MSKQEVAAYVIMESASDPVKPTNIQPVVSNGLFYVKFDTVLQRFNALNRNNREYDGAWMERSLAADHLAELMRTGNFFGEAGHPDTEKVSRILTIDPKLISHRINKVWTEGKILKGSIETMDDGNFGTQMTRKILQGMEPSFSLRALASLTKRGDGTSLMQSKAHIVTYDWVILPSHKEAYMDKSKPVERVFQDVSKSGNSLTESASAIMVMESQIKDFIAMESTNVNIVSNVCEVITESMTMSEDFKNVVLKENGKTYIVPIEDRISQEIRSFMSKF